MAVSSDRSTWRHPFRQLYPSILVIPKHTRLGTTGTQADSALKPRYSAELGQQVFKADE